MPGIINDLNHPDAPDSLIPLLGQVIAVGLETVDMVKGLSPLPQVSMA